MRYVALLRAVNVGGTGKLPMAELRQICAQAGFTQVRTYIASGNVILESDASAQEVAARLGARLATYAGKPVGVVVRTAADMAAVLAGNPFEGVAGNQVGVVFTPEACVGDAARGQTDEQIEVIGRETYVWFPSGMGRSKLKLRAMEVGTMRNINTVGKLVEMCAQGQGT